MMPNRKNRNVPKKGAILAALYGSKCLKCTKPLAPREFTLDHVIPRSKGGQNNIKNLQILCMPCNQAKANKFADDYRPWTIVAYINNNFNKIHQEYVDWRPINDR